MAARAAGGVTQAYKQLLRDADAADAEVGRPTVPSRTIVASIGTLSASRSPAWAQGPTEGRAAYLFRMCVMAYVYPEALGVFYDNYWRHTPNSYRGAGERALKRGSLIPMLQTSMGIAVEVNRPLEDGTPPPIGELRPAAVYVMPFLRDNKLGEDPLIDTAELMAVMREADNAGYEFWNAAVAQMDLNTKDRAYFTTARLMLSFMSTRSLVGPASRYSEAGSVYVAALENYISASARKGTRATSILDASSANMAEFFRQPPASLKADVRQTMAELVPLAGLAGAAADPAAAIATKVQRSQELFGQLDICSLYVQVALSNSNGIAAAEPDPAVANRALATLIVESLSDAISVTLGVAPRTVDARILTGLADRLLLVFYRGNVDEMRRDFATPWAQRAASSAIDVPRELAATMVMRATKTLERDLEQAKHNAGISQVPMSKTSPKANAKLLFNVAQAEFESVQKLRDGSLSAMALPKIIKRREPNLAIIKRRRKGALVAPDRNLLDQDEAGNNADVVDVDDDDDDEPGDRDRAFAILAALHNEMRPNAAMLARSPPPDVDANELFFPRLADANAVAVAVPPAGDWFRAERPSIRVPGPQSLARPLPAGPGMLYQPAPLLPEQREPDQGGVVEMDTDDQPQSGDMANWSVPTPRVDEPTTDGSSNDNNNNNTDLDDLKFGTDFVPPTPGAEGLRESDVFTEAPLEVGNASQQADDDDAAADAQALADMEEVLYQAGVYETDENEKLAYGRSQLARVRAQGLTDSFTELPQFTLDDPYE